MIAIIIIIFYVFGAGSHYADPTHGAPTVFSIPTPTPMLGLQASHRDKVTGSAHPSMGPVWPAVPGIELRSLYLPKQALYLLSCLTDP